MEGLHAVWLDIRTIGTNVSKCPVRIYIGNYLAKYLAIYRSGIVTHMGGRAKVVAL